ncbi:MAG: ABC transporter permease subunit [Lentisphaeria bacterium]|nr:ABC transporter permease subunit [Lentisphaeria bacterium]
MKRVRKRDVAAAGVVAAVLWQVAAMALRRPVLPCVGTILAAFVRECGGELPLHAGVSLLRVLSGIALALVLALPAGLLAGQNARADRLLSPFLYLFYPVPKVVFVPVLLLVLGVGNLPKVLLIALILFCQVVVLVRDSARSIRPELIASVRALGAGPVALLAVVYLPASLPAICSALRQSIGTAIAVLYIAELFATRWGLGYYIHLHGSTRFDYPAMYAGILAMAAIGVALFLTVDALERRLTPWRSASAT